MPRKAAAVRPADLRRLWLAVAAQSRWAPGCHGVLGPAIDTGADEFAVPVVAGFSGREDLRLLSALSVRGRPWALDSLRKCHLDRRLPLRRQMLGYDVDRGADGGGIYPVLTALRDT